MDFAAAIGTPVIAARTGTVMEVEADFARAGLDAETFAGRANFVRIVHDDGTMALYAHLDVNGVVVRVGQRVRKGEFMLAIEAMKMEHRIEAPIDGTVVELGASAGAQVAPGKLLIRIEAQS